MSTEDAALALGRFGLGARPGDLDRIAADPRGALLAELEAPSAGQLDDPDLLTTTAAYLAIRADQKARQLARRAARDTDPGKPMAVAGMAPSPAPDVEAPAVAQLLYRQEIGAHLDAVSAAEIGYVERLVDFWTNHFALQSDKDPLIRGMAGAFEREVIRAHVLGRFEDMLLAATRHPAMLLSLDNVDSIGPSSPAGKRSKKGLNENHAREILELHTVGVDGGYDQADVTEFARMLTGWSFRRDPGRADAGHFVFLANWHEPGDRRLMGKLYPGDPDAPAENERQGLAALHDLAAYPATARHIATKLVRHFVDDDPPPALVAEIADSFSASGGDLKTVSATLVRSDAAWREGRKFLTPQQFMAAAMRGSGVPMEPQRWMGLLRTLGQPPWAPGSPAGFQDDAASWLSPEGMTTRLDIADRIAQSTRLDGSPDQLAEALIGPRLSPETRQAVDRAESGRQAVALILMSPEFQWR